MKTPTFGLFDHIEGIPGDSPRRSSWTAWTSSARLIRRGSRASTSPSTTGRDLSMAPNQDVFIAAASQITDTIRLGPMVKLLPMHHPMQVIEDMCVLDHLTNGRLDYGVGRGAVPSSTRGRAATSAPRRSASSTTWE